MADNFAQFAALRPAMLETCQGAVEYAEFGHGPAVLCLHGAMGGYDQGLILARVLGDTGYRFLALSRPGYLGSSISLGRTPEQQADLYAAVLDALGVERAVVMAVSGGGPSAIHFALRQQKRCAGLVLVSAPAQPMDKRPPFSFKLMKLMAHLPWVAAALKRKAIEQPQAMASRSITDAQLLARTMADGQAWGLLQELQLSTMSQMTKRFVGTDNDTKIAASRSYPLEDIAVATLVLQGTADPLLPFAQNAEVLVKRISGSRLVALAGGEHAAIFSHRQEAREQVIQFLRHCFDAESYS